MHVILSVGGTKFETILEALRKNPGPRDNSMLANLNYVEGEEMCIDRDPKHFQCILNYLRDSSFYGLEGLVQHIEGPITRALLASVALEFLRNLTPVTSSRSVEIILES